ncbi:MAG: GNAT family N-acetyltransferase [Tahibacter sp.]
MSTTTNDEVLTFRVAGIGDVAAIVALVESAYRGEISKQGWTTEADLLDGQRTDPVSVGELLSQPGSRVLLAERNAQLVCCCHVQAHGGVCYFGMFAVAPGLQGSGVGKAVIGEAERIARADLGCRVMEMTVITVRDSLIAWYERRGYGRTGVRKPFPYGDEKFGIPKRDDLEFEILSKALV